MKTAILTGASKGIGLAMAKRLVSLGYKVYGLSRSNDISFSHTNFVPVKCDLLNTDQL